MTPGFALCPACLMQPIGRTRELARPIAFLGVSAGESRLGVPFPARTRADGGAFCGVSGTDGRMVGKLYTASERPKAVFWPSMAGFTPRAVRNSGGACRKTLLVPYS